MTDPLREIRVSLAPYRLALGDVIRYFGDFVYITHQFGFLRINAYTGISRTIVGVGYQNPTFPPSNIGLYVVGDQNQTVTQLAVNGDWVVVDNLGNTPTRPHPAALVWTNDAPLSYHGAVPKAVGYWWNRGGAPTISGDTVTVPNDHGGGDVFDARRLEWVGHAASAAGPADVGSIQGYTYRWTPLDGSGQQEYGILRSDVPAVEPGGPTEPTEPLPPTPPPPPPPVPPTPPPDVTQPCPDGQYRNLFTGECEPMGTTPPPPLPDTGTSTLALGGGRFAVTITFDAGTVGSGPAHAVPMTADVGYFWFFSANNVEVVIKIVDGRGFNGKFWLFTGPMTDVEHTIRATDLQTGITRTYHRAHGERSGVTDTEAFADA